LGFASEYEAAEQVMRPQATAVAWKAGRPPPAELVVLFSPSLFPVIFLLSLSSECSSPAFLQTFFIRIIIGM
jgi:hypothetical protein